MILYHGSNLNITEVDLNKCRPFKDFGQGFYCTTIKEQADLMANRVARIYGGEPCVSAFELNENIYVDENIIFKRFETPTEEWALFVLNNRDRKFKDKDSLKCNIDNKYDLVVGPVADDDIALLFRTFTRGLIDINTLVKEMQYKKFSIQYSFHSEKALKFLKVFKGE